MRYGFRGKTIAEILGYAIQCKAIREHVDPNDKVKLAELRGERTSKSKGFNLDPLKRNEGNTIFINEYGLYSLILRSKLESARVFKRWVTKKVLTTIRKTGRYSYNDMNHKYNDSLTVKIENETDLHIKLSPF